MEQEVIEIAGLRTLVVSPSEPTTFVVVMLHGYSMRAEDLAPFARSIGVAAHFLVPEGPLAAEPSGHAWWDIDRVARARALAAGPRDLAHERPSGAPTARAQLVAFLDAARARWGASPLVLVGFSQGGMLSCDMVLREEQHVDGLALLSASRIAIEEWEPLAERLAGLPVLVSHGREDDDLSFAAGEGLRDFAQAGGARVTWVPHDRGHELPPVVWRRLRTFLTSIGVA